jgi:hypothetical protein
MMMLEQIEKEKQVIARCEKSLAMEKLKRRRADTRRKIEFGGLVIKSGMSQFNKSIILGALHFIYELMKQDSSLVCKIEIEGSYLLKKSCD